MFTSCLTFPDRFPEFLSINYVSRMFMFSVSKYGFTENLRIRDCLCHLKLLFPAYINKIKLGKWMCMQNILYCWWLWWCPQVLDAGLKLQEDRQRWESPTSLRSGSKLSRKPFARLLALLLRRSPVLRMIRYAYRCSCCCLVGNAGLSKYKYTGY